jgi:hypothetical protein
MITRVFSLLIVWFPSLAHAADVATETIWWEVTTGIIAIPAAVIGLIYSVVLIKKTRVEVKKTELEIREKETALAKIAPAEPSLAHALITPLFEAKHVQLLLLRFVLLYVTLRLWGLAEDAFGLLLGGAYLGAQKLAASHLESDNLWLMIPLLLISKLPKLGELAILLGIGLPLFRDVSTALGVDVRSLIFFWRKHDQPASNPSVQPPPMKPGAADQER